MKYTLALISLCLGLCAQAQMLINPFAFSSGGGAEPQAILLVDRVNATGHGWSFARKLTTNYTGAAYQVRNAALDTLDVGFDAQGNVDTNALLAFIGGGDGWVSAVYDQIGTEHLTQSTAAEQPKVATNGVLVVVSGIPGAFFDGVDDSLWKNTSGTPTSYPVSAWVEGQTFAQDEASCLFAALRYTVNNIYALNGAVEGVSGALRCASRNTFQREVFGSTVVLGSPFKAGFTVYSDTGREVWLGGSLDGSQDTGLAAWSQPTRLAIGRLMRSTAADATLGVISTVIYAGARWGTNEFTALSQ